MARTLKCPHCATTVKFTLNTTNAWQGSGKEQDDGYRLEYGHCIECGGFIAFRATGKYQQLTGHAPSIREPVSLEQIYPKSIFRKVEIEVPNRYREDFLQSVSVLPISAKASAALSRRILQDLLREQFSITKRNLADEIDEFINLKDTPTYLAKAVDAVRHIGNFAAHPLKDTNTGEIVDVEPGEAEWLLDVLDALFDFAFVQPKRLEERRNSLNQKLQSIGKSPMK